VLISFWHPRNCQKGIHTFWSNRQWQVFWGRVFGANVQTSWRTTTNFSTKTKRPLTHHSFDNSWFPKTLQWFPTPLFAWPRHLWLFPIPQDEITAQRASFWHDWGDPRRTARGYRQTHFWELPGMYEIMGNTLELLYTCPRELLRRRRCNLGVTVIKCFIVKFPEVLGSTT
jgi:hypothetical protein